MLIMIGLIKPNRTIESIKISKWCANNTMMPDKTKNLIHIYKLIEVFTQRQEKQQIEIPSLCSKG